MNMSRYIVYFGVLLFVFSCDEEPIEKSGCTDPESCSYDSEVTIKMSTSQGLSGTTITNDGSTLTVGDEATLTGGAGAGGRIQV